MADIKQGAEWLLDGHLIKRKNKNFMIHYDYNKQDEEFGLTLEDLRSNDWLIHKRNFTPTKPNYTMYLFINKKYKMKKDELTKKIADGACFGVLNTDAEVIKQWINNGFNKIILKADDDYHIKDIQHTLIKYGIKSYIITDKNSGVNIALGVQIIDKNKYIEYFNRFETKKKNFFVWLFNRNKKK